MRRLPIAAAGLVLLVTGCSGDGETSGATTSTTAASETTQSSAPGETVDSAEQITVLVTNDDGVDAPGIDALVSALSARDDVKLVVVAPAENQSGSGGRTTDGTLEAVAANTASGAEATAVDGYPADSIVWAIQDDGLEPDLVLSGINSGQNIGPLIPISGTVGAARRAAQLGVPAVAVSQGFGDPPNFPAAVEAVTQWLDENIEAVRNGTLGSATVTNINVPTCASGDLQGTVEVPVVTDTDADLNAVDCSGTQDPSDDVTAFLNGWVAVSDLQPTGSETG